MRLGSTSGVTARRVLLLHNLMVRPTALSLALILEDVALHVEQVVGHRLVRPLMDDWCHRVEAPALQTEHPFRTALLGPEKFHNFMEDMLSDRERPRRPSPYEMVPRPKRENPAHHEMWKFYESHSKDNTTEVLQNLRVLFRSGFL